jgi:hypothetical protein
MEKINIVVIARNADAEREIVKRAAIGGVTFLMERDGPDGYGTAYTLSGERYTQSQAERMFGDVARIFAPFTIAAPIRFDAL